MNAHAKTSVAEMVAYAAEGAKQFRSSYDATGRARGLNENATVLFSDPERTNWIGVAPWHVEEGEVLHLAGQFAAFRVTWAQAASVARAA